VQKWRLHTKVRKSHGFCAKPANVPRILAQGPACFEAFAIVAHWSEEWSLEIIAVSCQFEIITDALCSLR
jgi:hypothetical protein